MIVIKGEHLQHTLLPEDRAALIARLRSELTAQVTEDGPVIFEIPLDRSDAVDVLVIWNAFENIWSEDRTDIIVQSYAGTATNIADAMGATQAEAAQQSLLPYAVCPMVRETEIPRDELIRAMLAEGATRTTGGSVDLRLPTMQMAESAHQRLTEKLPRGHWSIVQRAASLD